MFTECAGEGMAILPPQVQWLRRLEPLLRYFSEQPARQLSGFASPQEFMGGYFEINWMTAAGLYKDMAHDIMKATSKEFAAFMFPFKSMGTYFIVEKDCRKASIASFVPTSK
jgi:hypothetical protein